MKGAMSRDLQCLLSGIEHGSLVSLRLHFAGIATNALENMGFVVAYSGMMRIGTRNVLSV